MTDSLLSNVQKKVTEMINIFEPNDQNPMKKEHLEEINLEVLPGIHKLINSMICLVLKWLPKPETCITNNICGNTINNSTLSAPVYLGEKLE